MHQLSTFNNVASELGHDEPVLHAVVVTHRCLPLDPPESKITLTMPHSVTTASRGSSTDEGSVGADVHEESPVVVPGEDMPVAPLEVVLTVKEELANLNDQLAAWKVQRLTDLQTPSHLLEMQAAMERRLTQKRIDEQDRAQQRMERLLISLGTRIDGQLLVVTRERESEQAPSSSGAGAETTRDLRDSALTDTPESATAAPSLPFLSAHIFCNQAHLVTREEIALEERNARQALLRNMWDDRRLTHLLEDEKLFRRSIETREYMWRDRIAEDSQAAKEEDSL
ncbi:hypothetical protein JKF63_02057 [Porcisia hertigi]|uniref:Uncharacterized protein n=1 Tax=Porcisia hertigi TaxID=2761500 RepID=A0A836L567_9TRYP|nr:hypothetical protein JKF63_02057 [Porcisia hertigi]